MSLARMSGAPAVHERSRFPVERLMSAFWALPQADASRSE